MSDKIPNFFGLAVKILLLLASLNFLINSAQACLICNTSISKVVRGEIFDAHFSFYLFCLLGLFVIINAIILILYYVPIQYLPRNFSDQKLVITAGLFTGVGIGGFLDGILFHQILQTHNMLSHQIFPDTLVKVEINMFWDGVFHALTWVNTLIGIFLLWKVAKDPTLKKSTALFAGAILLGWGLFNGIEGLINHEILHFHHVIERGSLIAQVIADLLFLMSGIILAAFGLFFILKKPN